MKVDSQSSLKCQYENVYPLAAAARNIHNALEGAASIMDDRIINCMGMAMENILSRQNSAVSRNSDDFVPGRKNGFAEHLLQNAYNALYHVGWRSEADQYRSIRTKGNSRRNCGIQSYRKQPGIQFSAV